MLCPLKSRKSWLIYVDTVAAKSWTRVTIGNLLKHCKSWDYNGMFTIYENWCRSSSTQYQHAGWSLVKSQPLLLGPRSEARVLPWSPGLLWVRFPGHIPWDNKNHMTAVWTQKCIFKIHLGWILGCLADLARIWESNPNMVMFSCDLKKGYEGYRWPWLTVQPTSQSHLYQISGITAILL
jgi:hypothetical protein